MGSRVRSRDARSRWCWLAGRLQSRGYGRVKALFGGLDLYEFSLDPEVVGSETFLVRAADPRS